MIALFMCPQVLQYTNGKPWADLSVEEQQAFTQVGHGDGHREYVFSFEKESYPVDHAANGGPPTCVCGEKLVFVSGDNPSS